MKTLKSNFQIPYQFTNVVWKYDGPASWFFISMTDELSTEIRSSFKEEEKGWGRLICECEIKSTRWETSIWYDSKKGTYILPMKAEIRKKLNIKEGDLIEVLVYI